MTLDKTPSPTDAEIAALYADETGFALGDSPAALLDFARAVLAKWGSPVVAGGTQWQCGPQATAFGGCPSCGSKSCVARQCATPQPTQPQAGAVPMSEQFLQMMIPAKAEPSDFAAGVRFAEAHHGIKEGGQHAE